MSKIEPDKLKALRLLYQKLRMAEAELSVAQAQYNLRIATYFAAAELVQGEYLLCLRCGAFFKQGSACTCQPVPDG